MSEIISLNLAKKLGFLKPEFANDLIHLGDKSDGGYTVSKNSIRFTSNLVSYGLGDNFSFEKDFQLLSLQMNHILNIDIYDYSVGKPTFKKLIKMIIRKILQPETIWFDKYLLWIGKYRHFFNTTNARHHQRRIVGFAKKPLDLSAIDTLPTSDLKDTFLKVDIEGGEYEVLESLQGHFDRFTGMVVEFHDVGNNFQKFREIILQISKLQDVVYVHVNNYGAVPTTGIPDVLEISFVRKNLNQNKVFTISEQISNLNFPNCLTSPTYKLIWE